MFSQKPMRTRSSALNGIAAGLVWPNKLPFGISLRARLPRAIRENVQPDLKKWLFRDLLVVIDWLETH
ncbi:MAG: hypothetical protein WCQ21_12590, partial [Verrucomicrobiota bacterium]